MSEQYLIDALDDSLDRLAMGQTIEDCLRAHADVAEDLRVLLEIGQATKRARAERNEIDGMRSRLDSHIDALIVNTDFPQARFRLPQGVAVILVATVLLVMVGFFILLPREAEFASDPTATLTQTAEVTPEITATIEPGPSPSQESEESDDDDDESFDDDDESDDDESD